MRSGCALLAGSAALVTLRTTTELKGMGRAGKAGREGGGGRRVEIGWGATGSGVTAVAGRKPNASGILAEMNAWLSSSPVSEGPTKSQPLGASSRVSVPIA